jgi:putative ABC transport system permease protein
MFDEIARDVKLALRGLRRQPAFAATVVLVLGLGIGMATAMFTVFDSVLLRELPVRDQNRLIVASGKGWGTIPHVPISYNALIDLRRRSHAMQGIAGVDYNGGFPQMLRDRDRLMSLQIANVTGNFFQVLDTRPLVGRLLRAEDDVAGAAPALVLSFDAWLQYFDGDRSVIGRRLTVPGYNQNFIIVGVALPGLKYPANAEAWACDVAVSSAGGGTASTMSVDVLARLAPNATVQDAAAEYFGALKQTFTNSPAFLPNLEARVDKLKDLVVGNVRPALIALAAAVALLLLIACANVGNLLLVRAAGRTHEITIRRVLGAGFAQLVRQLFVERLVLGALGGCLGFVLARTLIHVLVTLAPPELPRLDLIRMTGAPIMTAVVITLLTTLAFGLSPALWAAGRNPSLALRSGSRGGSPGKGARRIREVLVAWQVALAVIVLAGAALVSQSLIRLEQIKLGFDANQLAFVQFAWPWDKAATIPPSRNLIERILDRVETVPGVVAATPVHRMPFSGTQGADVSFVAEGSTASDATAPSIFNVEAGGPDYFRTLGLPMLRGRSFTTADREGAPKVIIVSDAVARRLWPQRDPIGMRLRINHKDFVNDWATVVGVVGEAHYRTYRAAAPSVYYPFRQFDAYTVRLVVRTTGDSARVLRAVRSAIGEVDPDIRVWKIDTMADLTATPLAQPRVNALLLSAFGFASLLLATIGLYGIMAASVRQQTRELGIRAALGATPARLRNLVLSQAFLVTGSGALVGLIGAVAATRVLRGLLFEVSPNDPATLLGVAALLVAVALVAAYVPARRATRVDPVECLRAD